MALGLAEVGALGRSKPNILIVKGILCDGGCEGRTSHFLADRVALGCTAVRPGAEMGQVPGVEKLD